jgi:short-chain Z-isoprenyl diphosphate synthase
VLNIIYRWYESSLERSLKGKDLPKHVGVLVDGNRRWATLQGEGSDFGHSAGARKIIDFLGWCSDVGIQHTTLYLLSTDNLKGRDKKELEDLIEIISTLSEKLADLGRWDLKVVGDYEALPEEHAKRLKVVERKTDDIAPFRVNLAVAYGGRHEISQAVRKILLDNAATGQSPEQIAELLTPENIAENLYTSGQPDPDLLIKVDFLRALRDFQNRHRRFGS